jgi:integrase/recombinase XerD
VLFATSLRTVEVVRAYVGGPRVQEDRTVLDIQGKGPDTKDDFAVLPEIPSEIPYRYLSSQGANCPTDPRFAGVSNRSRGRISAKTIRYIVKKLYQATV